MREFSRREEFKLGLEENFYKSDIVVKIWRMIRVRVVWGNGIFGYVKSMFEGLMICEDTYIVGC